MLLFSKTYYFSSLLYQVRNLSFASQLYLPRKRHIPSSDYEDFFQNTVQNLPLEEYTENVNQAFSDVKKHLKRQSYRTIEKRYFLKNGPLEINLMTWAMKEQLKYLYTSDPEIWTPEALSKAFPISPAGVKRLVKSKWKPRNEEEIFKHDSIVSEQWKQLPKGKLGNANLLFKSLQNRFNGNVKSNLPATEGNANQEKEFLKGLKFTGEKDLFDKIAEPHVRQVQKSRKLKESFSSIITNYENKLKKKENSYIPELTVIESHLEQDEVKICPDLSYIESNNDSMNKKDFVRIATSAAERVEKKPFRKTVMTKRPLTFTEYSNLKNKSKLN